MAYKEPVFKKSKTSRPYQVLAHPTEYSGFYFTKAEAIQAAKLASEELGEPIQVHGPQGTFEVEAKKKNPISRHYSGHGSSVERKMRKLYGRDWKKVFYATEARRKNPDGEDDLADHEHAMIAAFHLAKLEECYAESGEDEALELTNEALDALCEVIDLQDSDIS